jgi:hypothetical protein
LAIFIGIILPNCEKERKNTIENFQALYENKIAKFIYVVLIVLHKILKDD